MNYDFISEKIVIVRKRSFFHWLIRCVLLLYFAGCAASFYPFTLVSSSDTAIDYSDIRDTMAYNLRPYISVGFTFREYTASTIAPSN